MPQLLIRLKKNADGTAVLTCTRADGSVTWQRQPGRHANFFPYHDLTHYAVETVLGHRRGFFGLISEGWDFEDFSTKWDREKYPGDAEPSELIVGLLDGERVGGVVWTAETISEGAAQFYAANKLGGEPPKLTEDQLNRIRARMRELFGQWEAVRPGEAMEFKFEPNSPTLS